LYTGKIIQLFNQYNIITDFYFYLAFHLLNYNLKLNFNVRILTILRIGRGGPTPKKESLQQSITSCAKVGNYFSQKYTKQITTTDEFPKRSSFRKGWTQKRNWHKSLRLEVTTTKNDKKLILRWI